MSGVGNTEQVRIVAEQVADTAILRFFQQQGSAAGAKPEMPGPLKWAAGIVAALMTAIVIGGTMWGASTLNALQITVARMDERQQRDITPARLDKIEERLARFEQQPKEIQE